MNTLRKHLSRIKGGRLAAACAPAPVVTLAISDVPGDDLSVIASGPTVPDASSCADALAIARRHRIALPADVVQALESGALETPKPADPLFDQHTVQLIATPRQSLEAAADAARAAGISAHVLSDEIEGESHDIGRMHAALARAVAQGHGAFARPCVLLSGGETTVTLGALPPGAAPGRGGRAGEFCLGLAQALQGQAGVARMPATSAKAFNSLAVTRSALSFSCSRDQAALACSVQRSICSRPGLDDSRASQATRWCVLRAALHCGPRVCRPGCAAFG